MDIAVCPLHPLLDPGTLLVIWVLYVKFLLVLKGRVAIVIVCRQNSSDKPVRQLCGNSTSLQKRHLHCHACYPLACDETTATLSSAAGEALTGHILQ